MNSSFTILLIPTSLKAQLNLPLDLALGPPLPLTLWAQEKTAPYSLPGTEQELRNYLSDE